MTKITAINGSPKLKDGVSGMLISQLEHISEIEIPTFQAVQLLQPGDDAAQFAALLDTDVLLIVFPLYVDSLPAPLLKVLTLLERAAKLSNRKLPTVYAVVNCGFYDAVHNRLAFQMIENFCSRAGLSWGYGIGIGGGGIIATQSGHMEKGVASGVYAALRKMSDVILHGDKPAQNVFVTPGFPRFLYKFGGHIGWRQLAKKNGVKSLDARPHTEKK